MDKKVVENKFNRVHTFQSCAAVGLIVEDSFKAKEGENAGPFLGAFLTPEEAREVAKALNDFADLAEADRNITHEQRVAEFRERIEAFNRDEA